MALNDAQKALLDMIGRADGLDCEEAKNRFVQSNGNYDLAVRAFQEALHELRAEGLVECTLSLSMKGEIARRAASRSKV